MTVVDDYIQTYPASIQQQLMAMRQVIHEVVPETTEKIGYGMPAFWWHENLVYFAVFKTHYGFYPTASGVAAFENQLGDYRHSKGAIQFPLSQPVPLELVRQITSFRYQEVAKKAES